MHTELSQGSLEKLNRAYDSPPWWYDARGLAILTLTYRSSLLEQVRFFAANIGREHLEVAVGSGSLLHLLLRWRGIHRLPSARVFGVDYAEAMLRGAEGKLRNDDVELLRADAGALPTRDESFDSANVANAAHCFRDLDRVLAEVWRVLKPGGSLAMNVLLFPRGSRLSRSIATRINAWGMEKGILETPYTAEDVRRRVLGAGFVIVSERLAGNTSLLMLQKPRRDREGRA